MKVGMEREDCIIAGSTGLAVLLRRWPTFVFCESRSLLEEA
jgi:hypothetical protein